MCVQRTRKLNKSRTIYTRERWKVDFNKDHLELLLLLLHVCTVRKRAIYVVDIYILIISVHLVTKCDVMLIYPQM